MSNHVERTTLSGRLPEQMDGGAPAPIDPRTGMHKDYWVLSEAERAKGFVRPVRNSYLHKGPTGPKHPLRDLTEEEHKDYDRYGYVKYEAYPIDHPGSTIGMFWTQAKLDKVDKGCGVVTRMGDALAETYARDPKFYGSTFCVGCKIHLPVDEFVWAHGDESERVGS